MGKHLKSKGNEWVGTLTFAYIILGKLWTSHEIIILINV